MYRNLRIRFASGLRRPQMPMSGQNFCVWLSSGGRGRKMRDNRRRDGMCKEKPAGLAVAVIRIVAAAKYADVF